MFCLYPGSSTVNDSVKKSSDSVKRLEIEKVDEEFKSVKALLVSLAGVDETKDLSDVQLSFIEDPSKLIYSTMKSVMFAEIN